MAPDETTTAGSPRPARAARASASAPMRSSSIPPSAVVSEDEPTLTTTLVAAAISSRTPACDSLGIRRRSRGQPAVSPARPDPPPMRRPGRYLRVPVEDDRVRTLADDHLGTGLAPALGQGLLGPDPGPPSRGR